MWLDQAPTSAAARKRRALDYAVLECADSGCGIPEDLLDSIFSPFFSTKEQGEGTGLGLSVCQGIVQSSGGDFQVTNTPQGASFKVLLPLAG